MTYAIEATDRIAFSRRRPVASRAVLAALGAALAACAGLGTPGGASLTALAEIPALDEYCLPAQRIVTRTRQRVRLVVHADFDAFVKSKAVIEGPTIQQYNWYATDGRALGVSCKLKSADHLNLAFGEGTAGPDGLCQDMNRAVYALVAAEVEAPRYREVVFDAGEAVRNDENPGMGGPDWLAPYTASYVDEAGTLHIATKGFQVDFTDPRFSGAPERFRGVHYCHFVAPDYLRRLLAGEAEPGITLGRLVDTSGPPPS